MATKPKEIPAIMFAPEREDCLRAISVALLKVRSLEGVTCEKLAKVLGCSVDTVRAASNEENLLSFEHIATLCHYFPDEAAPIVTILTGAAQKPLTAAERMDRIGHDLAALRREMGA